MKKMRDCVWLCAMLLVLALAAGVGQARQITFWSTGLNDREAQWVDTVLLPRFQKEKRIDVVHVRMQGQDMYTQLTTGQGPDVLMVSGSGISWGQSGVLQALNRNFDRWADRKQIPTNLLSYDPKTKNLYLIPIELDLYGIAFNKQAYTKAGISVKTPPNSWEALRTAAEKTILRWGDRIVRTGLETNWDLNAFLGFLMQLGENGLSPDQRQSRLATDKAVQTLEYLSSIYKLAYPPAEELWNQPRGNDAFRKFPDGLTAMAYVSSNITSSVKERNPKWQEEFGFFPARRYPSLEPVALASIKGLGITAKCRDTQSAWEFITWMLSPDITVLYHAQVGSLPTRSDLTSRVTKSMPEFAQAYQAIKYARFLPEGVPVFAWETRNDYQGLVEQAREVLKGKIDARSFLLQAQAQAQSYIDRWWQQQDTAKR